MLEIAFYVDSEADIEVPLSPRLNSGSMPPRSLKDRYSAALIDTATCQPSAFLGKASASLFVSALAKAGYDSKKFSGH